MKRQPRDRSQWAIWRGRRRLICSSLAWRLASARALAFAALVVRAGATVWPLAVA